MNLKNKSVIVTGGTRGLGRGVVESLMDRGAKVTVVARGAEGLNDVANNLGAATISADITDEVAAHRIIREVRPDVLILNAGTTPRMAPIDQLNWADFSVAWETDVKAGLYWIQAALKAPLKRGSRVLVGSSGAAVNGSQQSGGYAGAKRMLWFLAKYANALAMDRKLDIRFQVIVPRLMVLGTGIGDSAARAYSASMGITPEAFVARFGAPLPPRAFGDLVVSILENPAFADDFCFGLNGDAGVAVMEGAAA